MFFVCSISYDITLKDKIFRLQPPNQRQSFGLALYHLNIQPLIGRLRQQEWFLHTSEATHSQKVSTDVMRCKKTPPTATPQPNNCSHLISILPGFKTENQFIFLEKGTLIEDYVRHSYFRFALLGGSKLAFLIEILTDSLKLDVSKLQVTSLHCSCKFANLFCHTYLQVLWSTDCLFQHRLLVSSLTEYLAGCY